MEKFLNQAILKIEGECVAFLSIKNQKNLEKYINNINNILPIISIENAIDIIQGKNQDNKNHSVIILEYANRKTFNSLQKISQKYRLPFCVVLDINSTKYQEIPWQEKINLLIDNSKKNNIKINFLDRPLLTSSKQERKESIKYLLDYLNHCNKSIILNNLSRLDKLYNKQKTDFMNEHEIKTWDNDPLITFITAGEARWPFYAFSPEEIEVDLIAAKNYFANICPNNFAPIFWLSSTIYHQNMHKAVELFYENGYQALIFPSIGVAKKGDNLFALPRINLENALQTINEQELIKICNHAKLLF